MTTPSTAKTATDEAPVNPVLPSPAAKADQAEGLDAQGRRFRRVVLDTPLSRAGRTITDVQVRRPLGGDLRDVQLSGLIHMEVAAMLTVLPRITTPMLHKEWLLEMEAADLMALSLEVSGFLLTTSQKAEAGLPA